MADLTFEIKQHVCVLSEKNNGWTKEINVVSWNEGQPKLDIREWSPDRSSMRKGVTLNRSEFLLMVKSLKSVDASTLQDYAAKHEGNVTTADFSPAVAEMKRASGE